MFPEITGYRLLQAQLIKIIGWCLCLLYPALVHSQTPKLVLPVGHTSAVTSVSYSPDGHYIVTASWDNTAKIWQASDGRLLSDLKGHTESVVAAAYSPDGHYIVTASKDSTARIWAPTGVLLHTLKGHKNWINAIAFSPNSRYVATASRDGTARIWHIATGRLRHELKAHRNEVTSLAFSPDGKTLATASWDSTVGIWQTAGGRLWKRLHGHADVVNSVVYSPDGKAIVTASNDHTAKLWDVASGRPVIELKGHTNNVTTARFSPDGKYIVTASLDNNANIWQATNGKLLHTLQGHTGPIVFVTFNRNGKLIGTASADGTVRIWSRTDGQCLVTLNGHTDQVTAIDFSPDNKTVLSASWDGTAKTWAASDGRLRNDLKGHVSVITAANFSSDGNYIAAASWDSTAKIWDALDGRLLANLKGHSNWVNGAQFSPDGTLIVTASNDGTARIWEVPTGRLAGELKGHTDWVSTAQFSPDGKYILTASSDNTSKLWRVSDRTLVQDLKGHTEKVRTANFSPDGNYIITASWDNTAIIWSVATGQLLHQLKGHTDDVRTAVFSPNGKLVLTASWDTTAKLWDAQTGTLLSELKGHKASLNTAQFSPDGSQVVTTSMDHTARTWSTATGHLIAELKGHQHSVNAAMYSPDGKRLLTESWDGTAKIWDAGTGALLQDLKGHAGALKSATFSHDGKYVVTTSEDNTLKKWNATTGALLYTFFAVDSLDYLVMNNEGQYDGTEAARKMLYYVCENEIVDLEQYKNLSWEPGLAAKLMGRNSEPITAKKLSEINICHYTPAVEEKTFNNNTYHFEITPKRGGIGEVQVYVNEKLVRKYNPAVLPKRGPVLLLSIPQKTVQDYFSAGENQVLVRATTYDGSILSRGAASPGLTEKKPTTSPHVFILSIGVSQYKSDGLKLAYASKDAVDFSETVTAAAQKLFNTTGNQRVHVYTFNTETGSNRWPAKAAIEKQIDSIALLAKADDILLLFFAGHGVLQSAEKSFYLLTADASSFDLAGVEAQVAISTDELKSWLQKIKAAKQVLILDACNSGEVVQRFQAVAAKRDIPADQKRALESLKDKTGLFILSASASGQAAYETGLFGQGLLTYSLLSGIKLGGGLKDHKFIDVTRWFNFASDEVNTLAKDIGGRQYPQILGNASFVIGLVDKDVLDGINLSIRKKIFRRSVFIEDADLLNDDLNMAGLVDKELNNLSELGKESPLIFAPDNMLPDDYVIKGKYAVLEKNVALKVTVYKGQRDRVYEFQLNGTADKPEELAEKIVQNIKRFLQQSG